ncbi:hypothetical protein CLU81_0470 [Flavobacterium sp. 9]|uniref:hypothetical protein n=1 Tax=Flavobacterium sp. 9 TaxID=2035198 RepID=UPI000C183138|nr:hypothetical protein [Flavobacterium sp. 9]PIF30076.1 hypothetical protein CLU81_0470 [Flavobacterium sp. 9]
MPHHILNRGDSFIKSNDMLNPETYRIQENRYKLNELNYSCPNNDFDFSNSIRKNSFVLYPNQSKYFQTIIYLPLKEANIYDNSISYFIFKNKIKYDFNLIYISDSTQTKKSLPEFKLKELQENYVKIFHGKLFSNKIPVKFID